MNPAEIVTLSLLGVFSLWAGLHLTARWACEQWGHRWQREPRWTDGEEHPTLTHRCRRCRRWVTEVP